MRVYPTTLKFANDFVSAFHRHNGPTLGSRYALKLIHDGRVVGVAIVGHPLSRMLDDGMTAEVLRVCVEGAPKGACSCLYGACWNAWRAMGGKRMVTYTLTKESGSSLKGAGWRIAAEVKPSAGWARVNRPLTEYAPIYAEPKIRWQVEAHDYELAATESTDEFDLPKNVRQIDLFADVA